MGVLVDSTASERSDLGHPFRVVARGLLDMAAAAWIGAHPGFTDVVTDNGAGDQTVHLAALGAATMIPRALPTNMAGAGDAQVGRCHALAGGTLQDLRIECVSCVGADSNPGGGGAGWDVGANAVLGAAVSEDGVLWIEVIDTLV